MRLATFNLLHGRSLADGLVDPARLTAAVAALDADVLALQDGRPASPPPSSAPPARRSAPSPTTTTATANPATASA